VGCCKLLLYPLNIYLGGADIIDGLNEQDKSAIFETYKEKPQDIIKFLKSYSTHDQINRDNQSRILSLIKVIGEAGSNDVVKYLKDIINVRRDDAIDYGYIQNFSC
jgi:hypothetical protein